jgi:8-oxo-dGTP diphosphatase
MKPVLAASIAVFRDDGMVLLATRTKPPSAGVWSLPGGKLECGETLEQAALRELMEEVGVEARIIGFNRHVEFIGTNSDGTIGHHFVVCSYVGAWVAGEAQTGPEAGEVRWVDPQRLGGMVTTHHLTDVLASARVIWDQAR